MHSATSKSSASNDLVDTDGTGPLIGSCKEIHGLRRSIVALAGIDSNILITGETGTGKDLVAGLIHKNGPRSDRAFVCVNCAGIPDSLIESELFGYERGAFTGAQLSTAGKIEMARGGTVFFDEIGELSPHAQARLLRVIEEKRIYRLGGHKAIDLDIRIIAATNRDLDTLAMQAAFRKDLYFRLNVGRIHMIPLRERKMDIPFLVEHFIQVFNPKFDSSVTNIHLEVLDDFFSYTWPGNVRELRNVMEGVFISRPPAEIRRHHLPEWFRRMHPSESAQSESDRLLSVLCATNWNKSEAAERLQWSRMTLYRKIAKYRLDRSA